MRKGLGLNMEKKPLEINIEDLPEDISTLPQDAVIILDDYDEMSEDSFWEEE